MNSSPDPRDPSSQKDSNDFSIPMESEPEIKQTDDKSDGDSSDAEPATYFRNLSLKYFASEPLRMPASATAKASVMGYADLLPANVHVGPVELDALKKTSVMIFLQKTSILSASSFLKGQSRFVLSQTLGSCILSLTIVIMLA
uniref:Uncharacterized protein n=1 Tax=Brassica campestris TaxID=3711 RepID=M4EQ10_BRACM